MPPPAAPKRRRATSRSSPTDREAARAAKRRRASAPPTAASALLCDADPSEGDPDYFANRDRDPTLGLLALWAFTGAAKFGALFRLRHERLGGVDVLDAMEVCITCALRARTQRAPSRTSAPLTAPRLPPRPPPAEN